MEDNQVPPEPNKRDIPECEYMGLVYMNSAIFIGEENNYKFIKTLADIKSGELILVEHVLTNNDAISRIIIRHNEYLFNQYHPRQVNYQDAIKMSAEEIEKITTEKLSHNCFSFDKNLLLTNTITKMNHSCNPLCSVFIQESFNKEDTTTIFMEVYALKNIPQNTELTINYGPKSAHDRDFTCNCGKSLADREKNFRVTTQLAAYFSTTCNNIIREKIFAYLNTPTAKRILMNHYLANNGVFINKGSVAVYTSDGGKMINDLVNAYMKLDATKFNDVIREGPINETRLDLFIRILETTFF